MAFDAQTFKQVMSHWASGIAVITTHYQGEWQGFTANSLASVSVDPLLISMSVTKQLYAGELILKSGVFAINILKQGQSEWGKLFAGFVKDRPNRFEGIEVQPDTHGCPLLPDTVAWLSCKLYKTLDVGASTLLLGEVVDGSVLQGTSPLLYFQRQWGHFSADE